MFCLQTIKRNEQAHHSDAFSVNGFYRWLNIGGQLHSTVQ